MTDRNDLVPAAHNDQVPAQEKLEWVTPKISLMVAGETEVDLWTLMSRLVPHASPL